MLRSTVANDTTELGTNRDSVGCRKDALNVSGNRTNLIVMHTTQARNRKRLNRKKMVPIVSRPLNLNGTVKLAISQEVRQG